MLSLTLIADADKVVLQNTQCKALFKKKNLPESWNLIYDTKMFPLAAKKKCLVKRPTKYVIQIFDVSFVHLRTLFLENSNKF